jgi:hypothetical protein
MPQDLLSTALNSCPRFPQAQLYLKGPNGSFGEGVVYKVDRTGNETVLYSFTGLADGGDPETGLVSSAGIPGCTSYELYGTTSSGGDLGSSLCLGYGCGTVFKLTLPRASEPDPNLGQSPGCGGAKFTVDLGSVPLRGLDRGLVGVPDYVAGPGRGGGVAGFGL